jgi:hypothetical protein
LREEQTTVSDLYDGPATIRRGDTECTARVRLAGHLDPIDGRYHWRGTVFEELPADIKLPDQVTVSVGSQDAAARITERTPQGGYSVAGVGAPPFEIATAGTTTANTAPAIPETSSGS